MIKILIVDDEEAASNMLRLLIEKQLPAQKEIRCVNSPQEALKNYRRISSHTADARY